MFLYDTFSILLTNTDTYIHNTHIKDLSSSQYDQDMILPYFWFPFHLPIFLVLLNIAPRSYRFCFAPKDFSVTFQQFLVTSNLNPPPLNLSGSCSCYRAYFLHQSFHSYSSYIHATDTKLLPLNRFNHEMCPCNQYIKLFHIAGQQDFQVSITGQRTQSISILDFLLNS